MPEGLTPLVEWEWWSNFMPWLILVQVKGAMDHPVYQVVASVRLKVPWASHGRQFTKNSVAPPLLLHQSCLTLAPHANVPVTSGTDGNGVSLRPLRRARRIATQASNSVPPPIITRICGRFEWPLFISSHLASLTANDDHVAEFINMLRQTANVIPTVEIIRQTVP